MNSQGNFLRHNVFLIILPLFIGIFSVVGPRELYWPFLIIFCGSIVGISLILFAQPEDRKALFAIFILALLLRLFLALLLYDICFLKDPIYPGFSISDGYAYHYTGSWIANMWRQGIFPGADTISLHSATGTAVSPADYWSGFIYFFVGVNPLVLFFINSVFSSLAVVLIYFITKQLFNSKAAMMASLFSAFWPSLILWSTQNLKEPLTILLLVISFWSLINLKYGLKLRYILLLALAIFFLMWYQQSIAIVLTLAIFMSILFSANKKIIIRILVVTGMLILLILYVGNLPIISLKAKELFVRCNFAFQSLDHLRRARTIGANSAFLPNVNISSLPRTLVFLPFGLTFVLLSPLPWQSGSYTQILAIPEMSVWYILLPFTFWGIWFSIRKNWKQSSAIILFLILMSGSLALYEGNIGTLFRHRAVILPFFLIFTSIGIAKSKENKTQNLDEEPEQQ